MFGTQYWKKSSTRPNHFPTCTTWCYTIILSTGIWSNGMCSIIYDLFVSNCMSQSLKINLSPFLQNLKSRTNFAWLPCCLLTTTCIRWKDWNFFCSETMIIELRQIFMLWKTQQSLQACSIQYWIFMKKRNTRKLREASLRLTCNI